MQHAAFFWHPPLILLHPLPTFFSEGLACCHAGGCGQPAVRGRRMHNERSLWLRGRQGADVCQTQTGRHGTREGRFEDPYLCCWHVS